MRRSSLCLCFISLSMAFGQAPADKVKADRSSEPRLKQVFEAMGKIKSVRARVDRAGRESSKDPWMPGGCIDVACEAGKGFRVQSCGSWGDGQVFVSDGKTLLQDPLDLTMGVTLKDPKPTIFENDNDLAVHGGSFALLFYFLAGSKGFDEMVSKDGEIVALPSEDNLEGIRFKSTKIGTVSLFFDPKDAHLLVHRIEFDDLDQKKEQAKMFAEWGAEMPVDPLDVQWVTYLGIDRRLPKNALSVQPPKGLAVKDERKKAKVP